MALVGKSTGKCDICECLIGGPDHIHRSFNPDLPDIFPQRTSKIPGEVFGNSDGVNINYT